MHLVGRSRDIKRSRIPEGIMEQLSLGWPLLPPDFLFCKKIKPFFIEAIFSPKVA